MSKRTVRKIRAIARVLAGVSFLLMMGFIGGMEMGGPLTTGMIGATISVSFMWLFAYIGGLFN